jgi:hypothetical protein
VARARGRCGKAAIRDEFAIHSPTSPQVESRHERRTQI